MHTTTSTPHGKVPVFVWPVSHFPNADLSNLEQPQDFASLRAPATSGPTTLWAGIAADLCFHHLLATLTQQADFHVFMTPIHLRIPETKPDPRKGAGPYAEELIFAFFAIPANSSSISVPLDLIRPLMRIPEPRARSAPAIRSFGLILQAATSYGYFKDHQVHLNPPECLVATARMQALIPSTPPSHNPP
jgi:hypothetical protein